MAGELGGDWQVNWEQKAGEVAGLCENTLSMCPHVILVEETITGDGTPLELLQKARSHFLWVCNVFVSSDYPTMHPARIAIMRGARMMEGEGDDGPELIRVKMQGLCSMENPEFVDAWRKDDAWRRR
nr:hypothetical protein CFP56_22188 [Quercus suber]